jgi:molybdopterin-containing oxidoreductase family iron-sulfur binding subunit
MNDQRTYKNDPQESQDPSELTKGPLTRRSFLKLGVAAAAGYAGFSVALSPLRNIKDRLTLDEFLQQHYERLTSEQMQKILVRIENDIEHEYGVKTHVTDIKPLKGVEYAFAINIGKCIGCRRCVYACMKENNTSRNPQIQYIRVLEMDKGSQDVEKSEHYYNHEAVPQKDKYYMPVQCHQCRNAPCTKACPIRATWQEPDGIVVVDYNWCIGCRYCMAACPYWARRFNFARPTIPKEDINIEMAYLGNRIRPRGVVEKCTFCLRRVRQGMMPACVEVCPTGSRIFCNISDPDSPINYILRKKRVYIFKEEAKTIPRLYYYLEA